jgi:cell division protein FtsB
MFTMIVYAVVAAAVAGFAFSAWSGFKSHIAAPYVQAQIKADQAVVDRAEADKRTAESANATLRADLGVLATERDRCTASVKRLEDEGKRISAEKDRKMDAAISTARFFNAKAEAAEQRAKTREPTKAGVTCEQTIVDVDKSLNELAIRRMLFGTDSTDSSSGGSKGAPGNKGGGAGALRVAP